MEYISYEQVSPIQEVVSSSKPFILGNTEESSLEQITKNHIIPVYTKTNEPLISHSEFIDAASYLAKDIFHGEMILKPNVRVSHPVKGRIPEAKDKPANQLYDWEKTIYYERAMFVIEVPSIQSVIDGNTLSLTIGGVKAYNTDNLYSRTQSDQHFKMFIGFQNKVCSNLCIWTDGFMSDVKVRTLGQLKGVMRTMIENYNQNYHLHNLSKLTDYSITEHQFAQLIGRARMYQHLPTEIRNGIPPILFGDQQMNSVVRDFYKDESFCRDSSGNINLWKLYNLFTGANKSSYIDSFLDRSVNAYNLSEQLRYALDGKSESWYLN